MKTRQRICGESASRFGWAAVHMGCLFLLAVATCLQPVSATRDSAVSGEIGTTSILVDKINPAVKEIDIQVVYLRVVANGSFSMLLWLPGRYGEAILAPESQPVVGSYPWHELRLASLPLKFLKVSTIGLLGMNDFPFERYEAELVLGFNASIVKWAEPRSSLSPDLEQLGIWNVSATIEKSPGPFSKWPGSEDTAKRLGLTSFLSLFVILQHPSSYRELMFLPAWGPLIFLVVVVVVDFLVVGRRLPKKYRKYRVPIAVAVSIGVLRQAVEMGQFTPPELTLPQLLTFLSPAAYVVLSLILLTKDGRTPTKAANKLVSESPGRLANLSLLGSESRARCLASWMATGLPEQKALTLADNPSVGDPKPEYEAPPGSVRLVTGEIGCGKSLILERIHQKALQLSKENVNAPLPLHIYARDVVGRLEEAVLVACDGLGDPRQQGANIVIDRADEIGMGDCSQLLYEARVLAGSWPSTSVVIASRIMPPGEPTQEIARVSELTEEETKALVGLASGREATLGVMYSLPESIREAIKRPLFALLLGLNLRYDEGVPASKAELIANLVQHSHALEKKRDLQINTLLSRLAVVSTDRGGSPVPATEIVSTPDLRELTETGFVVSNRDGTIAFSLPILTQWFAAQSLSTGLARSEDICRDPRRLENWREALAVAISILTRQEASKVLAPIVELEPAFAAGVLSEGVRQWGIHKIPAPPALECGNQLREAMQSWIAGIAPLASLIAPVRADGSLLPAVTQTREESLIAGWLQNGSASTVVTLSSPAEWHSVKLWRGTQRMARPGSHSAWSWKWTKEELAENLKRLLTMRGLTVDARPLIQENNWVVGQAIMKRGSFDNTPISVTEIQNRLDGLSKHDPLLYEEQLLWLAPLREELSRLQKEGQPYLVSPWPGPDWESEGGKIWSPYSSQQMLARARAVYPAAIEIYVRIVDRWFPKFKWLLFTAATLPACLRGTITVDDRGPGISWFLDPQPVGSSTTVELELSNHFKKPELEGLYRKVSALRSAPIRGFRYVGSSILYIWGPAPATKLAYDWLEEDLRWIDWL